MVKWAALSLVLLSGCFPDPLDETGLRCDDTRACGPGYTCFDEICYRIGEVDAGPANWLPNPGFEDLTDAGQIAAWAGRNGVMVPYTTFPRSGQRSAKIYSLLDGGETPSLQTQVVPVHDTLPGETWCGLGWVRADTPMDAGVQVVLLFRERDDAGVQIQQSTPVMRPQVGATWLNLQESYVTKGAARFDLRVAFLNKALPGQFVDVDDVALKRSATGDCTWP
jgi:hypothetical protein